MAKSVFISSTSKDLADHRKAVNDSILRLEMRPIDMVDFGSQPGGASGVSITEVAMADIFIGILAYRYGYVPEKATKSVTEQEYDEAVRLRVPRLMYLVDPSYDWPKELIEDDETAQERLAQFKARVEKNEVRSLFTNPDDLAEKVTADLAKLERREQRQKLTFRTVRALVVILILIILLFLVDPGIRSNFIELAGLASATPTPTPTATATSTATPTPTPTATPTATSTPTVTPTPLEGAAFSSDTIGIVLADFEQIDPGAPRVEPNLERELNGAGIPFVRVHHLLRNKDEARAVSDLYKATIVVYGQVAAGGIAVNYEITPRQGSVDTSLSELELASTQLESFSAYIFQGMDTLYVIDFTIGQVRYFGYDSDGALEAFNDAVSRIPEGRERDVKADALYFYRGNAHYVLGNLDRAIADYDRAIELNPDLGPAYSNRGAAHLDQRDYPAALADLNRGVELAPNVANAYLNRGSYYYAQGDNAQAIADYTRAIELDPTSDVAYDYRGNAYSHQQEYAEAFADYAWAIELNPNNAQVYYNRGNAYFAQGDSEQAIANFDQAIEISPNNANYYNNRGVAYVQRRDYERAIADLDRALELDPNHVNTFVVRGLAHYRLGDYAEALADYQAYQRLTGRLQPFMEEHIAAMSAEATATITLEP